MIPEQQGLLQRARESLDAAKLLLQNGYAGFAASRAYYAMLYAVQALLLEKGLSFSKHSAVIASFGRYYAKTGEFPVEYHRYLIDSLEIRQIGDYGGMVVEDIEAGLQIARAEQFLQLVEDHFGSRSAS